jgi:hypothetical protein
MQFARSSLMRNIWSDFPRLKNHRAQLSGSNKVRAWGPGLGFDLIGDLGPLPVQHLDNFDENFSEISEWKLNLHHAEFERVRNFMISGPVFRMLVGRIQLLVLGEEQYTLFRINSQLMRSWERSNQ